MGGAGGDGEAAAMKTLLKEITTVIPFIVLCLLGMTGMFLLLDALMDFQRIRNAKYLTLPEEFEKCFQLVRAPSRWTIPELTPPYELLIAHDCAHQVTEGKPLP